MQLMDNGKLNMTNRLLQIKIKIAWAKMAY